MTLTVDAGKIALMLDRATLKGRKTMTLSVGYTAPYAVYVHENLEARHPNGGNAKFLTRPLQRNLKQFGRMLADDLANKKGLWYGLERVGKLLKQYSQAEVPVDTGYLRDSWWMDVE